MSYVNLKRLKVTYSAAKCKPGFWGVGPSRMALARGLKPHTEIASDQDPSNSTNTNYEIVGYRIP